MAVNLSGRELESPTLVEHVRHALRENGIAPATLTLEVTESVLVTDPKSVAVLTRLKALGLRLAIDDFGTGYSSISSLRRFPVDILRIDREFTDGADSPDGRRLLRGVAQLGLRLVAEGIERSEQIVAIADAGCLEGQGFLYARPVDGESFAALLRGGPLGPAARRNPIPWPASAAGPEDAADAAVA